MLVPATGVVVRRAVPGADTAALAALRWAWAVEKDAVPAGAGADPSPEFLASFGSWIAQNARSHTGFLALAGERPVGMAWLAVIERVPDVLRPVRRSGFVQSVFVLPAERDAGIGALLMAALLDEARARGLDYLLVTPSPRSVPFYRREGFTGDDRLSLPL